MLAFGLFTGAAQASSVTLDDVEIAPTAIESAASVSVTVELSESGDAGTLDEFQLFGAPFSFGESTYPFGGIAALSLQSQSTPTVFFESSLQIGPLSGPAPSEFLLTGDFLDSTVDVASGSAEALFGTTGGTQAVSVGPYFVVQLEKGSAFTNGSNTAALTVFDAALAPVPLPAGAVLLVGALGVLGLARRRKAT